jgi:glycosyltransferase involved in cell wall biosynthesis
MKLLFITPNLPVPPRRGYSLIALNHIKRLSERHEVHLVSFQSRDGEGSVEEMRPYCRSIHVVRQTLPAAIWNGVRSVLAGEPGQVGVYRSRALADAVRTVASEVQLDAVVAVMTRMAQYAMVIPHVPAVLNLVDPMATALTRSLPWRPMYLKPVVLYESARILAYERRIAPRFAALALASARDADDYADRLGLDRIAVVRHAVEPDDFREPPHNVRAPDTVVISGTMGYAPTVDGVLQFVARSWPLVRSEIPHARLFIVGQNPARRVRALHGKDGIVVTGTVPDVRTYLWTARVSVCPVRLDIGVQTKVLEALAAGTPVVTTAAGNAGVGAVHERDLVVADNPAAVARAVVRVLRGEVEGLESAGREFVARECTWEVSTRQLEAVLTDVARVSPTRSAAAD